MLSFICITLTTTAQVQAKVFNLDSVSKAPKTEAELISNSVKTTHIAIYKGTKYPVYYSRTGKLFIVVKSTTSNNLYRKYIKS